MSRPEDDFPNLCSMVCDLGVDQGRARRNFCSHGRIRDAKVDAQGILAP